MIKMLPREKLVKYGVSYLEEYELLSIILGFGSNNESVFDLSKRILSSVDSVCDLIDLTYEELIQIKGIKSAKATKIIASIELAKRIFQYKREDVRLDNPADIYNLIAYDIAYKKQEEFLVLFLNKGLKLISKKILAIGNDNLISIDIKQILRLAIKLGASNLVLVHNHPSGTLKPSEADVETTKKIIEAANLMDINIIDHLIISIDGYYSFLEHKLI